MARCSALRMAAKAGLKCRCRRACSTSTHRPHGGTNAEIQATAKARGVRLGNPNAARVLSGKQVGNKQAVAAIKRYAQDRAENLRAIVGEVRKAGLTSVPRR